MKKVTGILALFITLPIWFYLIHWLLKANNAGELQMFLFWVYVPFSILINLLVKVDE